MIILGVSTSGGHETAACIVRDGELIFACAEERLTRKKLDDSFPVNAIRAGLDYAGIKMRDVDHVAFSWPHPMAHNLHNVKLLLTGKWGNSFTQWERVGMKVARDLRHRGGELDFQRAFGAPKRPIHFINHHVAHALSAYCLSGFEDSAVLVVDGRGSSEATTLWHAQGGDLRLLETYEYPNSLGVFYAGITDMLGFQPMSEEWKVMGLAAYGKPVYDLTPLIRSAEDSYCVHGRSFFSGQDTDRSALELVLGPKRNGEELNGRHQNIARSAQDACENAMLALLRRVTKLTGSRKLCLSGGVGLNCKANGELLRSGLIDEIYVQPAAGDDGAGIGAAFAVYRELGLPLPRKLMCHSYLGPQFTNEQIEAVLKVFKLPYRRVENPSVTAAELLAQNHLVGWFQGRMEFGPRALGNRSILADPRFVENRDRVNDAVKFRENWRPFAPSVLREKAFQYFQGCQDSPYMILSYWAEKSRASAVPAVVHVDGSCRVQTVERETNPRYHALITEFEKRTGIPVVMNTSFNLRGEPIVCSPRDAVQTFYTSGLDDLVMGDFHISKR